MTLKGLTKKNILRDIFTGIIIALVSIPISMGYAQVSGLPPVCGLYGSVFPILIFGLFSTSTQFIFGVDAAPAALVGAYIASIGVEAGTEQAAGYISMITLFTGIWLLLLYFIRAGKAVTYISTPVMGGFISGISTTIILMQIPKLLGGTSGRGELFELSEHIVETVADSFRPMSLVLGAAALFLLLLFKKLSPKIPMSVIVMAAGAVIGKSGFAEKHGVACLGSVPSGLPEWRLPEIMTDDISGVLTTSLTVAVVIMAETLLASNNMANKIGRKIDNNREILVYSLGNLASCFTGCCPVNGSVSRSSMGEQYGGSSQLMSISASVSMIFILLFCTGFIQYLPVPVLTAIVISALLGAVEFHLIKRLYRQDRRELIIFFAAFFGVLVFGTVYGVVIGVVLSFVSVIIRTANPKRSFLGVIPGREGFHSLERNAGAEKLKSAVIYRFSGNLYFANINIFADDIENAITEDTKCVVVDSGAVCNIDITAADKIAALRRQLAGKGIGLYFASHIAALNDRFRQLGLGSMIEEGFCRMTLTEALKAAGITPPYETVSGSSNSERTAVGFGRLEFDWAFGENADKAMERYMMQLISRIDGSSDPRRQLDDILKIRGIWKGLGDAEQEQLLEHLELHSKELAQRLDLDEATIEKAIVERRLRLAERIEKHAPELLEIIKEYDKRLENELKENDPELYKKLMTQRRQILGRLILSNPEYTGAANELYDME